MNCPKCKKEYSFPIKKIIKHGNQNFEAQLCTKCNHVLSEKKTNLSQLSRLVIILIIIPAVFLTFFIFSIIVRQSLTINYQEFIILITISVLLLVFISEFRKMLQK